MVHQVLYFFICFKFTNIENDTKCPTWPSKLLEKEKIFQIVVLEKKKKKNVPKTEGEGED